MSFFEELKRRNVVRVGIAYAVATWILLQITDVVAEILQLPEWAPKLILLILVVGLVPALIFAWAFEMTPDGIKREKDVDRSSSITPNTGRKLDRTIIGLLVLGMAYFIWESRFQKGPDTFSQENTVQTTGGDDEKRYPAPFENEQNVSAETSNVDSAASNFSTEKSIAVLPFTNRSPDANDAYFTDGVHDDLLTQLAKIEAFSVISRTSVMEYRDTAKNLKQIGEELGVSNIMEGAVQRAGNRVRINVQLIDAATDEHLWAEIYDRQLTTENLFDIQSEIAKAIAAALHSTLTDSEIASVSNVPTENVKAYELYLQGKRFALGETEIGFDTSVDLYREALKIDPNFKLAWIGLAQAYMNNYWSYGGNPADREKTREAIDKAKEIDPDFPELYMAEGFYHYWGLLDYDTAIKNLDKAIELMPGNAEAHMWKGWASRRAGLWEQAIESMQKAIKLNPRIVINLIEFGQTLGYVGRYDEALEVSEQAYRVDPDSYWAKSYLADMLILAEGDVKRANTLMIGAQHTNDSGFVWRYWEMKTIAAEFEVALEIVREWSTEWEINREGITLKEQYVAETLMMMGRRDEAGRESHKAIDRLQLMKKQDPEDYRIFAAELRSYAVLGELEKVARLESQYLAARPTDAVQNMLDDYGLAQIFALAGMTDKSLEILERLFSDNNPTTIKKLELDPYFNAIRQEPEFLAMLERHR